MKGVHPSAAQAPAHTHVRTPIPMCMNYTSVCMTHVLTLRSGSVFVNGFADLRSCGMKTVKLLQQLLLLRLRPQRGNTSQVKHSFTHTSYIFSQKILPSHQLHGSGEKEIFTNTTRADGKCSGSGEGDMLTVRQETPEFRTSGTLAADLHFAV